MLKQKKVKEEKSGEGLKQYLKDLYSYSTNPGYQYFVSCIVGDEYNPDDLWLLGGFQDFPGYCINLAIIDRDKLQHVNPFYEDSEHENINELSSLSVNC
ncbi:MAG: hypothetical protein IKO10_09905 [Lachnospiraceae bacterium]|nr:hypothetical protein [Lachnospiraceae bacterium]